MRFEDAGITEMTVSNVSKKAVVPSSMTMEDHTQPETVSTIPIESNGTTDAQTLEHETDKDEFAQDAQDYDRLIEKIDLLLEKLKLDA
jgi:hypothetical protein